MPCNSGRRGPRAMTKIETADTILRHMHSWVRPHQFRHWVTENCTWKQAKRWRNSPNGRRFPDGTSFAQEGGMTSHIRIGVKKAGRRINDSRGNPGRTICGAELTGTDITVPEARRLRPGDIERFNICQVCLAKIPAQG
jgi:hypothetical protein